MIENAHIIFNEKPKVQAPPNLGLPKKQPPKIGLPPLPKNPLKNPGSTPPKFGLPPLPASFSNPTLKTPPFIPEPITETTQNEDPKDKLVRSPSDKQLSKSKRDTIHVDDAWKEYETGDGRKYYHNEITNVTQWDKPESFESKSTRVKKHKKRSSNVEKTRSVTLSTPKLKKSVKDDMNTLSGSKGLLSPLIPPPLIAPPSLDDNSPNEKSQKEKNGSTKQLTDTERIAELEKRVEELENLVKSQGQLIEKLLSKTQI